MEILTNIIDKFNSLSELEKSSYNEQETRQEFIDIFLKILGWDVTNSESLKYSEREVLVEEIRNSTDRPDYTLRRGGRSQFFVEAKRISEDILTNQSAALQARRYGWNAGHKITVLTNFKDLIIYQTYSEPNNDESEIKFRYKHYHYTEYKSKFDEISELLSRDAVFNGSFNEWTNDITPENATKESLNNIFLEDLNEWRVSFGQSLLETNKDVYSDTENLNMVTQRILNQIIFLRFAEDNELENSEQIHKLYNKKIDTKQFLRKLDNKYNSELFNDFYIEDIPDNKLSSVIEKLYYPNSSYDFSIIPLEILSQMYENYLQSELIIEKNTVELIPTQNRKVKSVVSTPIELVSYMVKEGLEEKTKDKSIEEILNLKVCDLSVGSGIFLVESYNYLESELIDRYSIKYSLDSSPSIVPFEDKLKIITQMLYGCDINPLAVQLSRFSLQLRVLRDEPSHSKNEYPILPSLETNIVTGNSLVAENDLDAHELPVSKIKDIMPMQEGNFFSMSYDLIVGNPPYLKIEDIKNSTTAEEINVYKSKFISSYKQYDKYFLFMETAIKQILNNAIDNSSSVLIVQNKFLNAVAGKKLRKYIKDNKVLQKIINFQDTQFFEEVSTYVCVVKLKPDQTRFEYLEAKSLEEIDKEPLLYETKFLTDEGWFLVDNEELRTTYEYARSNFPSITTEIEVSNGVQTSRNSVYVIKAKEIKKANEEYIEFKKKGINYKIEKDITRKYYEKDNPQDVGKSYSTVDSKAYIIFPYANGHSIDPNKLQKDYPLAWRYLNNFKNDLLKRDIRGGDNDHWYRYGRQQYLKEAYRDKIIAGVMSNQPNFNIDRKNHLLSSGGTAGYISIVMKDDSKYSLEYIQAWLSHSFTDNIFKVIGSDFGGDFYTHGTYLYDAIPLLPVDFTDDIELNIYNSIHENVNAIEQINEELIIEVNINNRNILTQKKENLINENNNYIDELMDLKMGDEN